MSIIGQQKLKYLALLFKKLKKKKKNDSTYLSSSAIVTGVLRLIYT